MEETLGTGSLGVVYRVRDRDGGTQVALKLLHGVGPERQHRLKHEFRRVADIAHPNLVTVYELEAEAEQLFFTMEIVDGEPFVSGLADADEEQLRQATRQLLGGLATLHAEGLVHRDIKPNNVLVEPDGRVVVLDFGLAATLEERRAERGTIVGTAAYMAPEQASGQPATGASDLYAVGVMLYELLVGRPLSQGPPTWLQRQRRNQHAPDVTALAQGRDPSLCNLVEALLARSPYDRPSAEEAAASLGLALDRPSGPFPQTPLLLGRRELLRRLEAARRRVRESGEAVVVEVRGDPGIGKTALIEHFVEHVCPSDAVVLRGRCYERKTVPFKGFDTLAEAIAGHVRPLPFQDVAALFPDDCGALRRLFPVLRTIIPRERIEDLGTTDPVEVRRQAREQFCDLLRRLADRCELVVFLDDLHWSDPDSHGLLEALLTDVDTRPGALFLLSVRGTESSAAGLAELLDRLVPTRQREDVGPLSATAARELARNRDLSAEVAEAVVQAAAGNPLLIELAGASPEESLAASILRRADELEPEWREAAELVAIAGVPVSRRVIGEALGGLREPPKTWIALRAACLVRTHGPSRDGSVEPWHDRIRESLTASLPVERRQALHASLGAALEADPTAEAHIIGEHLRLGGLPDSAFPHLLAGADEAMQMLAFDRSAELYRNALSCADEAAIGPLEAQVGLAEALTAAGRLAEAGEAFERAARLADEAQFRVFMARASQAWVLGGHTARGRAALVPILGEHKSVGPLRSVVSFAIGLIRTLGAMDFKPVREDEVAPEVLRQIDTLWSMASSITLFDEQSSTPIFGKFHVLALNTGEPVRATRAQIFSSMQMCSFLPKKAGSILEGVRARLDAEPHPELEGFYWVTMGMWQTFEGRFEEGVTDMDRGLDLLRERCAGGAFETTIGEQAAGIARLELGRLGELRRTATAVAQRAADRGNFYEGAFSASFLSHVALSDDEPERARSLLTPFRERLAEQRFHQQHWLILASDLRCDLYEGRVEGACARWWASWPEIAQSYLLYLKESAVRVRRLQGVLLAAEGSEQQARKVAAKLAKAGWPGARGGAAVTRAILARDDAERCAEELSGAAQLFDVAAMHVDAAACRFQRARVLGDPVGPPDQRLRQLGVSNPERWAAMVVPGLRESGITDRTIGP